MKRVLRFLFVILLITSYQSLITAQIAINTDGSTPDASAMLDIISADKGVLIPRLDSTSRKNIASPATGLMVFDTDNNSFWYYSGTTWTEIGHDVFTTENDVIHTFNNEHDFVIGADSLNYGGNGDNERKFFFDKGKGAIRAGRVSNTNWDLDTLGGRSIAVGTDNVATSQNTAAFGFETSAIGKHSFTGGWQSVTNGIASTAFGKNIEAQSYGEFAVGTYNTTYTPNSSTAFNSADRAFVVGNGADDVNRSDAFIIYKNGNTSLNGALTINDAFTFPTADGSANQILKTDGSGTLSWSDMALLSDNDNDTKILVEESSDEDTIRFYTAGTEHFNMSAGRLNILNSGGSVLIGENAGLSDDLTDNNNIAIGENTLKEASSFAYNNVAIGYGAGEGTSGSSIYHIDNVFIGYKAGSASITTSGNVAIGTSSGRTLTTGSNNTFLGNGAGRTITTGGSNVMLGKDAGGSNNVSNQLFIDNSDTDNPLIWGDFSTDDVVINGNLGINTTATNAILDISGTSSLYSFATGYYNSTGSGSVSAGTARLSIYADKSIAANAFIAHSDRRIKNIKGISNSQQDLATLQQIEITNYTMIDTIGKSKKAFKKVIAQQVAEVFPQAITKNITEIVPDIYQTAIIDENGWVTGCQLPVSSCPLKVNDKVQIVFDNKKEIVEVLEVKENAFRVKLATGNRQQATVFIYGRQVNDFHTVDYQAISMLNVSATQQLAKEVEALKIENQALKASNETLKAQVEKINELEAKLEALLQNQ